MSGNTILITGGGSGIGLALAERFLKAGNDVIVTGRNEAKLAAAQKAHPALRTYVLDVDNPLAITAFAQMLVQNHPRLNVLINNAGMMVRNELTADSLDLAAAEATITTNFLGPIRMIAAFLPHLSEQENAAIVNVTSGLAFVPLSTAATYCATKAALHSYSLSLRHQLSNSGVEVIELTPPGVQTELTPGQSQFEAYMPLDDYADEVMSLFAQEPTPAEIRVECVKFLRNAEREGRFDQAFDQLNNIAG